MVINNYHDKKYIEVNEDEIIFYKWYGKRRLKIKKIRAAFMNDDYRIIVLYGQGIRSFNVSNVSKSHRGILGELIEAMNREDVLFAVDRGGNGYNPYLAMMPWIIIALNNSKDTRWELFLFLVALVIITIFLIYNPYYSIFIYDYNKNLIRLEASTSKNKKEFIPNKDKFTFNYNALAYSYNFKYGKKNNIFIPTNIIYPSYYKDRLVELCENSRYSSMKL